MRIVFPDLEKVIEKGGYYMTYWSASLDFLTAEPFTEDTAFDLLDALNDYGASVGMNPDYSGGSAVFFVDADNAVDAASKAVELLKEQPCTRDADIVSIHTQTEAHLDEELAQAAIPPLVGNAEIARMAGVSRQRATQIRKSPGFPKPAVTVRQGELYVKAAVEDWLERWERRAGLPPKERATE